jgi:hypothetical protein
VRRQRLLRAGLLLLGLGLGAALGGCNYDAALATYCRDTGLCLCEGDSCCGGPGAPCLDGCCGRLVCGAEGLCETGEQTTLSISPTSYDFGEYSPGSSAPPPEKEFVVTNTGALATLPLSVDTELLPSSYALVGTGCEGRVLEPGASCTVRVRYAPLFLGLSNGVRLKVQEPRSSEAWEVQATALLRGSSGVELEVQRRGDGVGSIVSTPNGIDCNFSPYSDSGCKQLFAVQTPVVLEAKLQPGTSIASWTGCSATDGNRCTVDLRTSKKVTVEHRAWLQVEIRRSNNLTVGGYVSSQDGRIQCGGSFDYCSATTTAPTVLRAQAGGEHVFLGWEGACTGQQPECQVSMAGPTHVVANFAAYNRMFLIRNVPLDVLRGDLSGADELCARNAPLYGVPNDYRAWLSVEGRPAHQRLGAARGWVRAEDFMPFADTVDDLAAGALLSSPERWARLVATGTGAASAAQRCGDWSSSSGSYVPGISNATTGSWERDEAQAPQACSTLGSLYCFGTRYQTPMIIPPVPSRRAFLSSPWTPSGGLAGADAHCQEDAAAADLAGSYKALLATSGKGVDHRYRAGLRYARVDAMALQSYDQSGWRFYELRAPLNVTADRHYIGSTGQPEAQTLVWTGGASQATLASTCNDWQGGTGSGTVGRPEFTDRTHLDAGRPAPCTSAQRLYCLQD